MGNIENLDQIRAKNAFEACKNVQYKGENNGDVAKQIPEYIQGGGILGALAFALSKGEGYAKAFDAIAKHLSSIGKINANDAQMLQEKLLECSPLELRDATVETMLYLNYFRRFAKKQ